MPLFGKKSNGHGHLESNSSVSSHIASRKSKSPQPGPEGVNHQDHQRMSQKLKSKSPSPRPESPSTKRQSPTNSSNNNNNQSQSQKLVFHCQQAQGSPTGLISGFTNVKELYQKIADSFDFPSEDILFCTLNTHRIDMDCLLSSQLCLDDFIFAHRKGSKKEVEVIKTEEALGLTITDNGTGYAFIKRIKENSTVDQIKAIGIGDHIEKIDNTNLVGWRHVDVARHLKAIPVGEKFTLRLIEPLRSGFVNIGPKSKGAGTKSKSYGSGKETLRFRANGPAVIEVAHDDSTGAAIEKINKLLENFMGINDADLATQIWEIGSNKANTMDMAEAIDSSELETFGFTDDFIIEVWGIISDAKSGRLRAQQLRAKELDEERQEEEINKMLNNSKNTRLK